jgi:internalin A
MRLMQKRPGTRRLVTFGLPGLFAAITLAAVMFSWVKYERDKAEKQRQAVMNLDAGDNKQAMVKHESKRPAIVKEIIGDDTNSQVSYIALTGPKISDADLAPLDALDHVESVNLRAAAITDKALHHVGRFEGLERLNLAECKYIRGDGLRSLSRLHSLRVLDLSGTGITDDALFHLTKLRDLRTLVLRGTQIGDGAMHAIGMLPKIERLGLDDTEVSDVGLSELRELAALKTINVRRTRVTDDGLRHLSRILTLERIGVAGTKVSNEGLHYLSGLPNVVYLDVAATRIDDSGIAQLLQMPKLEILTLSDTEISGKGLEMLTGLPTLRELHVVRTKISDADLQILACTNLRLIECRGSLVTAKGAKQLQQRMPNCSIIR